tara:strand:- start:225 stop:839 length:615 start_codon:yes stop_codon:yes gene_type:complete
MYALVESGSITKIFTSPKGFILNDIQYPQDIFYKWTKDEKEAIGIYQVITDSSNFKDKAYYNNTNEEYTFTDNQVVRSWGTATPKRLEDENAVDENGDPVLDDDGKQIINYGLKTEKKRIIKDQASGLLAPTDWYVVKATEVADYNVPENITTFRADVRSKSNEMETQIDACNNVDELKQLYEYTKQEDGTITRPLAEFPKEVV